MLPAKALTALAKAEQVAGRSIRRCGGSSSYLDPAGVSAGGRRLLELLRADPETAPHGGVPVIDDMQWRSVPLVLAVRRTCARICPVNALPASVMPEVLFALAENANGTCHVSITGQSAADRRIPYGGRRARDCAHACRSRREVIRGY